MQYTHASPRGAVGLPAHERPKARSMELRPTHVRLPNAQPISTHAKKNARTIKRFCVGEILRSILLEKQQTPQVKL